MKLPPLTWRRCRALVSRPAASQEVTGRGMASSTESGTLPTSELALTAAAPAVLMFLDAESLTSAAPTNRVLAQSACDESLWKQRLKDDFRVVDQSSVRGKGYYRRRYLAEVVDRTETENLIAMGH